MIRPTLQSFRLISIEAKSPENDENEESRQVNISANVELALAKPTDEKSNLPLISLARIKLDAQILQNESDAVAFATATYIGKFIYPAGLSFDKADTQMLNEEYQRELVSQVYPMANLNILQQLASMGYQVNNISIGLPGDGDIAVVEDANQSD